MRSDRLADRISGAARLLLAVCVLTFTVATTMAAVSSANAQSSVRPPTSADTGFSDPSVSGEVPGNALGSTSDSELWRAVKSGTAGNVSIPDKKAGMLVQYEGQIWREIRNGMVPLYGAWAILGMIVLLAVFFAVFGRLRIDDGPAGITITRFSALERAGHWMTAGSFVLLALTGLNMLYGRSIVIPVITEMAGRQNALDAYAAIAQWGKYIHNYVAFAFIAGLFFIFFNWALHNLPSRDDIVWLLKGGGIFVRSVHPPARKFNAGQKIVFWLTIFGGASVALSGWTLLFPFTTSLMTWMMEMSQTVGLDIPAWLGLPDPPYAGVVEQQMNQIWHAAMGLFLTTVIIAHIYIGSLGMEGAFDAMGSGEVDLNWAREHHSLWVEELERELDEDAAKHGGSSVQPAE